MNTFGIIIGQRPPNAYTRLRVNAPGQAPPRMAASAAPPPTLLPRPRRIPHEFYPTPPEATRALLSVERFDGDIWEPACGHGAIARELIDAGYKTVATDLVDHGYGVSGIDFLRQEKPLARHIVTNPPYGSGLAAAFITKALAFTRQTHGSVAMLINLASLAHRTRTAWWRQHPPARLYAIDDIVCWPEHLYGPAPEYFTRHRYCWAVWTRDHSIGGASSTHAEGVSSTRRPTFWWLSAAEFRAPRPLPNNNKKRR